MKRVTSQVKHCTLTPWMDGGVFLDSTKAECKNKLCLQRQFICQFE